MSPAERPRDWDKELAEIDKVIAAGPEPKPVPAPGGKEGGIRAVVAAPGASAGPPARRSALFTWLRLLLGLTLGAAMTQWPYTHGCGLPLYGYLAAVGGVIVAASWSMVSSWTTRSAVAHFLSIALLFWGTVLAAREVLPRVGYATEGATWTCETGTSQSRVP